MSHYHIYVPANPDEVKVIKAELHEYLMSAQQFAIMVVSEDSEPSIELQEVLRVLFIRFLGQLANEEFEGLN